MTIVGDSSPVELAPPAVKAAAQPGLRSPPSQQQQGAGFPADPSQVPPLQFEKKAVGLTLLSQADQAGSYPPLPLIQCLTHRPEVGPEVVRTVLSFACRKRIRELGPRP